MPLKPRHLKNSLLFNKVQSLRQFVLEQSAQLVKSGTDSPRLCVEVLVASVLGFERNELLKRLIIEPDSRITETQIQAVQTLLHRRAKGEPLAYILGKKEFYGRDFMVNKHTLVPRPETELLVETATLCAKQAEAQGQPKLFADLGTGSGCIAISLGLGLPSWIGCGLDLSFEALQVARENAQRLDASNVNFVCADFTTPLFLPASLSLIVANPPYISTEEYLSLSHEVRDFEPATALVPKAYEASTKTGLEDIASIIERASVALCQQGWLFVEMGCTQGADVLALCDSEIWEACIIKDLAGHDRILQARLC